MLYGAEVWAICGKKLTPKYFEDLPAEKNHLSFCKAILGVNKRSSNAAVRGELGAYPIYIRALKTMFSYWERLKSSSPDSLLNLAYSDCVHLHNKRKTSWFSTIVKTSELCDMNIQDADPYSIETTLKRCYSNYWRHLLTQGSKTQLYKELETTLIFCNYLTDIKDKKCRQAFTKLRISAHPLAIETGRYTRPITDRKDRLCKICHIDVEDEEHFFTRCPAYHQRIELLSQVGKMCPNFHLLNSKNQTMYLLSTEGHLSNAVAHYCLSGLEERDSRLAGGGRPVPP